MPYRQLIRVEKKLNWEELAPLTDAGVTPYRGIKKLRAAGVLGPDRVMAVFGAGGLGSYAVQYAKLLSSGATVVVFARSEEKLAIAKERGADYVINTRGKSLSDLRDELVRLTGKPMLDAAIDCVGAIETIQTGFVLLATAGAFVSVGLVGNRIDIPLFLLLPASSRITVPSGRITATCRKFWHWRKKGKSSIPSSKSVLRRSTKISSCCAVEILSGEQSSYLISLRSHQIVNPWKPWFRPEEALLI